MSCFDYTIYRSGFDFEDFLNFLKFATHKKRDPTFFDYIAFLKSKKMEKAPLPLQSGDILVYYDKYNQIVHAALVCKNPKKFYTKFGNGIPFAYKHDVDETPILFGERFQIFRKKQDLTG